VYDSVRAAVTAFTEQFEGNTTWMYLDVKGLVTTGRGNLIDPPSMALELPWRTADGVPATHDQILTEWLRVKGLAAQDQRGGGWFKKGAQLWLAQDAVDLLTMRKAASMDQYLTTRFANYATLYADAQLAVLSMAWAMGPAFHFPKFEAALAAEDYVVCACECQIDENQNPGVKPRNEANEHLFVTSAESMNAGLDRAILQSY